MNKKIIKQIGIFFIFILLHTPIFADGMIEDELQEPLDSENETAIELDFLRHLETPQCTEPWIHQLALKPKHF